MTTTSFYDEYADYDPADDFGMSADGDDTHSPQSDVDVDGGIDPCIPVAPSGDGWRPGPVNDTSRLLALLPSVPKPASRPRRPTKAAPHTSDDDAPGGTADRPGDRLDREVSVSAILERLGWRQTGESDHETRWERPDHENDDGSHDATIYRDEDGVERLTIWSERQKAAWKLSDTGSRASFGLLTEVFCRGDAKLAASISRHVLEGDDPVGRLVEMLQKDENETLTTVVERLREWGSATAGSKNGKPKSNGKSAKKRFDEILDIDWKNGCMRYPTRTQDGQLVPGAVRLGAAARIASSTVVIDDMRAEARPKLTHDIEVSIEGREHVVLGVPDEVLHNLRTWLPWLPTGVGRSVFIAPAVKTTGEQVEQTLHAMVDDEHTPKVHALRHVRWYAKPSAERIGYVTSEGMVTTAGRDESVRAVDMDVIAEAVSFPDSDDRYPLETDLRAVLEFSHELYAVGLPDVQAVWHALLSTVCLGLSGVTPSVNLLVVGPPETGKTTLVSTALQMMMKGQIGDIKRLRANFEWSAPRLAAAGAGAHHAVVWIDDYHPRIGPKADAQDDVVDEFMRRGYEEGSRAAKMMRDDSGNWVPSPMDPAQPAVILTAEVLPAAPTSSTLGRVLAVHLLPNPRAEFVPIASRCLNSGQLHRVGGAFVRSLAAQIDECSPGHPAEAFDRWRAKLQQERQDVRGEYANVLSARATEVLSGFVLGWRIWCRFVAEALSLGDVEATELRAVGEMQLRDAAVRHSVTVANPTQGGKIVIRRLREAAHSKAYIEGLRIPEDISRCDLLGHLVRPNSSDIEEPLVALLPKTAARYAGLSNEKQLYDALNPWLVKDRTNNSTRPVHVPGEKHKMRCACIPLSVWESTDDGDPLAAVDDPGNTDAGRAEDF
jgi:hypothetical protein